MESLFGLNIGAEIQIVLKDEESRKTIETKVDKNNRKTYPLYFDGESVSGKVQVRIREGKRLDHQGIKGKDF